jgi:hypothetical protein
MSPFAFSVIALVLVVSGIVLRNFSDFPEILGFILVTAGFSMIVIKKWLDKDASKGIKYVYTVFLLIYVYFFISSAM